MKRIYLFFLFILLIYSVHATTTVKDNNYIITHSLGSFGLTTTDTTAISIFGGESGIGNYSDANYFLKYGILYTPLDLNVSIPIGTTPPTVGINVTLCRYKRLGYYNTQLAWLWEVNCI